MFFTALALVLSFVFNTSIVGIFALAMAIAIPDKVIRVVCAFTMLILIVNTILITYLFDYGIQIFSKDYSILNLFDIISAFLFFQIIIVFLVRKK